MGGGNCVDSTCCLPLWNLEKYGYGIYKTESGESETLKRKMYIFWQTKVKVNTVSGGQYGGGIYQSFKEGYKEDRFPKVLNFEIKEKHAKTFWERQTFTACNLTDTSCYWLAIFFQ